MLEGNKKEVKVCCPKCGCEYLPGEIYVPDRLVGQPKDIERTPDGKILLHDGTDQDIEETFVCEKCGKPFKVIAHMFFETVYEAKRDVLESYTEPLYKEERFYLEEK